MKATDPDQGENARITYSITAPSSDLNVFRIEPNTGIVRTNKPLDYETKGRYVLTLTAMDAGNPRRSGTTTLTINVIDVNEPPKFTGPSCVTGGNCYFEVTEEKDPGVLVTRMAAVDPDSKQNCRLEFSLESLDKQYFNIDKYSGNTMS